MAPKFERQDSVAGKVSGERRRIRHYFAQWLLQFGLLFFVTTAVAGAAIPVSERNVLLNLYIYTNDSSWANNTGWTSAAGTECTWYGITCDSNGVTITAIDLSGNGLRGTLPPISQLTNLESFNVGNGAHFVNFLVGTIPSLSGLTHLKFFVANGQEFTGPIPTLAGLSNLVHFDVSNSQLSGAIPGLAGSPNLAYFSAYNNQLTGSIPDIGGLSNLVYFRVNQNQLTGSIPNLTQLTSLTQFNVGQNRLTGDIPALAGLAKLQYFVVADNQLTGSIPELSGLTNLQDFFANFNKLTGSIPDLSDLASLVVFAVGANQLTGIAPAQPHQLAPFDGSLCPNQLTPASVPPSALDLSWNIATATTPWSQNCAQTPTVTFVSITSSMNYFTVGRAVTLTAAVYGAANPTGTVTFTSTMPLHSGVTTLCDSVPVTAGLAVCKTSDFSAGTSNVVSASYSGDANNAPFSNAFEEFVDLVVTPLLIETSSANPAQVGQSVDPMALLVGGKATDVVTFYDGATPLCSNVPIVTTPSQLVAHCATTFSILGDHSLTAQVTNAVEVAFPATNLPIIQTIAAVPSFDANQYGLTGSWYNHATSGQGFEIQVYPDLNAPGQGVLFGGWFTYDVTAAGGRRWYGLQGNVSSVSPSAVLQIFDEEGGNLNAPPSVGVTGALGVAELDFSDCATASLTYNFTDGSGRSGTIPLSRLTPNVTCSPQGDNGAAASDYLLSGNWYNPNTSGQGLIFDFSPSINNVFAGWYTFAPNGQQTGGSGSQRWFTLQSNQFVAGMTSLDNITIIETSNGIFDSPTPTTSTQVGTVKIAFQSCNALTLSYQFSAGENQGITGTINLQRVGPTPTGCSL